MTSQTDPSPATLDQRRAQHAWNAIQQLKTMEETEQKEYAGEAKKLPIRIMASGLGQALAFVLAKAKNKKPNLKRLHQDLTDWVMGHRGLRGSSANSLLQSIVQGDASFLRRATDETLAYLQWLNRFAEAEGLTETES